MKKEMKEYNSISNQEFLNIIEELLFNMQKIPFRLYISHKGSHVT